MDGNRFVWGGTDEEPTIKDTITGIEYPSEEYSLMELINRLYDETAMLKQRLNESETDERQLGIEFMGFKMKLIEVLQKHYNQCKGQTLYADVYLEIAEEMGVDLDG